MVGIVSVCIYEYIINFKFLLFVSVCFGMYCLLWCGGKVVVGGGGVWCWFDMCVVIVVVVNVFVLYVCVVWFCLCIDIYDGKVK